MESYIGYILAVIFFGLFVWAKSTGSNKTTNIEAKEDPTVDLIEAHKKEVEELVSQINFLHNENKNTTDLLNSKINEINEISSILNEERLNGVNKQLHITEIKEKEDEVRLLACELDNIRKLKDDCLIELENVKQSKSLEHDQFINEISNLKLENEKSQQLLVSRNLEFDELKVKNDGLIKDLNVQMLNAEMLTASRLEISKLNEEITKYKEEIEILSKIPVEDYSSQIDKKHILIVDDSIVIRTKLSSFLKECGFDVSSANDGQEALDILLKDNPFSLIITDLEMPNMNGYDLIYNLNANGINIPVIAITGHDEVTLPVEKSSNFYGISKKPWDNESLQNKLKLILSK